MASERLYEGKSEVSIEFAKRNLNRYAFSSPEEADINNSTNNSTPEKVLVTPTPAKIQYRRLAISEYTKTQVKISPYSSPNSDDEPFVKLQKITNEDNFVQFGAELRRPLKSRSRLNRIKKNSRVVRRLFPEDNDENTEYRRLLFNQ